MYEPTSGTPFDLSVDGSRGIGSEPSSDGKGNLVVGDSLGGIVDARATFSIDVEPTSQSATQNHWQVLLRHQSSQTYYAVELLPEATSNAHLIIFWAKSGSFHEMGKATLPFAVATGQQYVVEGRVSDTSSGVTVTAKAWPAGENAPASPQLVQTDAAADALTSGQVGVRLSIYSGPATETVDDFTVTT